jgi:hypothetical protein
LKYRVTIEMIITESEIVLINVGDHDAVYWFKRLITIRQIILFYSKRK